MLNLSTLTTVGSLFGWTVDALAGGTVNLSGLSTIDDPGANIHFGANGTGSQLNLSALTSFTGSNDSDLAVTGSGTVTASGLTTFSGVQITLDGTGVVATSQWVSLTGGGSLTVTGGSYSFPDLTDVSGSSLVAEGGATLSLPNLTTYTQGGNATFEATGANSLLNLSALATVGSLFGWTVDALAGGTVNLSGLSTIDDPGANLHFGANGTGSQLNLSALTSYTGSNDSDLAVTGSGTVMASSLTAFSGVQITLDGTGVVATSQWVSLTGGGSLTVTGGSYSFPDLTDVSGSSLVAEGGATLSLPNLTTYTQGGNATFEATGVNSLLNLSALTTVGSLFGWTVDALAGGTVNLSGLSTIDDPGANLHFGANGTGSQLNLSALTSYTGSNDSDLAVTGSGTVMASSLTAFSGVQITLDGTGVVATSQWVSLTGGGSLTVTGGSYSFPDLTDVSGSSLVAEGGATLSLPNLTTYTQGGNATFEATGANSLLNLSALATVGSLFGWTVDALAGGTVNLSGLSTIDDPGANLHFGANGTGSQLNLSALTSYTGSNDSDLAVTGSGTVLDGSLTSLNGTNLTLDGTGTIATSQITGYTSGSLTFSNGTLDMAGLTDAAGSTFNISGETTLQLSSLAGATLDATGGTITLSGLTNADGSAINVSGGASLALPAPTEFTGAGTTAAVSGSGSSISIGNGIVTSIPNSGTDVVLNVPQFPQGMALNFDPTGTFTGETTFNVGTDATVDIASGTFSGGVTGNLAQGGVLDLTGGQTITYSGTLTGSGSGTVQLNSGTFVVGIGGVTLNFPGSMFQWTGGEIDGAGGLLTNQGTMNLAGPNEKQIYADGTLDNFGTIIQTGAGDFGLHSDNQAPTTLNNEPAGLYLIESDAGVNNEGLGDNIISNMGTIRKTAGTGTSTLDIPEQGSLSNTGTIEADSGTLYLEATTIDQVSAGTLSGGTWNALGGSTLEFPSGTSITANQANITLDGAGATITALGGLSSNSGGTILTNGATFSTTGGLNNAGSLTIGAGSTLTVNGKYAQGTTASLTIGIGGASSGNEYGQLNVTGAATLAGSVNASTASGFTPTAGNSYPIVTYASETGGNSLSFTGVNSGSLSIFQPVVGATSIVLNAAASPANLVVQPFTVPANAVAGQTLTVTYQVDNQSDNAVTGTWTDSVYLSTQTTLNSSSVLLGRVQQTGVAVNGQYSQTVTAPVPGMLPDDYYVIVLADSLGLVPELNRASTELASTSPVQVTLPTLALASPISGTIASGQSLYYQLTLSAGQDVAISANFAALQGGELYVGYQSIPSSGTNLVSSTSPTQTTQQVVIPDTQAGTYDILVQGDTGSGTGASFTLSAQTLPLQVTSVGPNQAGDSGTTTLTIQGAEFTGGTTVSLVPHAGGTAIAASQVTFQGSTTLFAQFNLAGAAPGSYDIIVASGGQRATDPSAFTITSSAAPGHISYNLSVPSISRPGRIAYLTLTYSNDGGSDALAPLFVVSVTSDNATIGLPGQTNFSGLSVQLLGIETSGPAGTLPPGYQGTFSIPYESTTLTQGASIQFSLQVLTGNSTAMNWSSLESSLQPSYIPNAAWPAVFANLTAELGSTTESYLTYLDDEATYLSQLGEYTDDVQRLFGFAINTANDALTTGAIDSVTDASFPVPGAIPLDFVRQFNASISGRDTIGPFGYGWTDSWQISASDDSAGNVTITDDSSLLYFAINSNGG